MTDIDLTRLQAHLQEIVRSRPAGSRSLTAAQCYAERQLRESGWTVRRHEFRAVSELGDELVGVNLIAMCCSDAVRTDPNTRWLCVAAHLDSRPETPGADDNATGVAALLEIARCWPDWKPDRGVELELVVTDLEESGMLGGAEHARMWTARRDQLMGMAALEMIGYCDERPNSQALPRQLIGRYPTTGNFIAVIGNQNSTRLIDWFREGHKEVAGLPVETLQVPENGNLLQATRLSDHSPFWDAGFPAVMITDTSFLRNPHYHHASDTLETLDPRFLHQVTCGCLRSLRRAAAALLP